MDVLLGIIIKVCLILFGARIIGRCYKGNMLYSFAWLFSYIIMLSGMIILSLYKELKGQNLLWYMFLVVIVLAVIDRWFYHTEFRIEKKLVFAQDTSVLNILAVLIFIFAVIALTSRNIFYYDTTDDALVQGMSKLAFIQQHESLFVRYDTWTINIFSNEWFGEMNGLFYLLISGNDHLVLLGNVEVYLFIYFTIIGAIRNLKYNGNKIYVLAGYFSSIPVILGLAMTIKTDLIALIMVVLLMTTLLEYFDTQSNFLLFASICLVGATAAAKIILVPIAGLLGIGLVVFYFKEVKRKLIMPVVAGIGVAIIFCVRYLINLIQYHNPIQRALNEKIVFSFQNLVDNLVGIIGKFCETSNMVATIKPWSSHNWVLAKGMGYGGEIILILLLGITVYYFVKKKNKQITYFKYIVIPYICSFIYTLVGTIWYDWSFRYYFPYILCVEIFVVILFFNVCLEHKQKRFKIVSSTIYTILFICMCANFLQAFRSGQAIPTTFEEVQRMSKTEQKLIYSQLLKYEDLREVEGLSEILETGGNGIILGEFSTPTYHFFGDNNCVKIDLVKEQDQLLSDYSRYDFVAIASLKYDSTLYRELEEELKNKGYKRYVGSYGAVFMP